MSSAHDKSLQDSSREAEALVDLLVDHGKKPADIAAAVDLTNAELQALKSGKGPLRADELIRRLHAAFQSDFPNYGRHLLKNAVAISVIKQLHDKLAITQAQIAERLGCSASHIPKIKAGEHRATEEFTLGLHQLLVLYIQEVKQTATFIAESVLHQQPNSSVDLQYVGAGQTRGAECADHTPADITAAVRTYTLSAIVGMEKTASLRLPQGFPIVTHKVGECQLLFSWDPEQCGEHLQEFIDHESRLAKRHVQSNSKKRKKRRPPPSV